MEEEGNENDLLGNVVKPPALRVSGSLKSTLSGRLTPRSGSPLASFRRSQSIRTPRKDVLKDVKWHTRALLWIRGRSLFTWLMIIVIWSYFGFHLQSTWIIGEDSDEKEFNNGHSNGIHAADHIRFDTLKGVTMNTTAQFQESFNGSVNIEVRNSRNKTTNLVSRSNPRGTVKENLKKWLGKGKRLLKRANATNSLAHQNHSSNRNSSHHTVHNSIHGSKDNKQIFSTAENSSDSNGHTNGILKTDTTLRKNSSYGLLVGPFDITEEQILGWHAGKRYGTCNRKGSFAHIVNGRLFTLIFHELSMTGAPLAMLELGAEILSCGGQVSAVALSKKGGLMREITKRGIKLLKDRTVPSFKVAMKSELVIAGSAVSASWIGKYLSFNKRGGDRLVWWIMENRYEYFNRSKHMLQNAKALLFLSDIQSQQWKKWCVEEGIRMPKTVEILPLSVNDELAFVAGIPTSLNTPTFSVEKMVEKKNNLRNEVRRIMGVTSNDMLLMTLSSINPGKGQLKLLKSVLTLVNETFDPYSDGLRSVKSVIDSVGRTDIRRRGKRKLSSISEPLNVLHEESVSANGSNHSSGLGYITNKHANRKLSSVVANSHPNLKLLIGSVGSKSNKVPYVNSILNLVSRYPDLVNILLWTPSTVHVAPLYAAADVYVINAQGAGETFGRVTIEAMAFGLPVLGTDAGGTKEIVDHNVTGLLHPVGELGMKTLSQNIRFLLKNEPARKHMGQNGKEKVEKVFLKHHMYNKFAAILNNAMAYT